MADKVKKNVKVKAYYRNGKLVKSFNRNQLTSVRRGGAVSNSNDNAGMTGGQKALLGGLAAVALAPFALKTGIKLKHLRNIDKSAKVALGRAKEIEDELLGFLNNPEARRQLTREGREALLAKAKDPFPFAALQKPDIVQKYFVVSSLSKDLSDKSRMGFVVGGADSLGITGINMAGGGIIGKSGLMDMLPEHQLMPFLNYRVQTKEAMPNIGMYQDIWKKRLPKNQKLAESIGTIRANVEKMRQDLLAQNKAFKKGYNADSRELAAYMIAVENITGKPVDLIGHSAGGITSNEAFAIYSKAKGRKAGDGKVVNIASPNFDMLPLSRRKHMNIVSTKDQYKYMVPTKNVKAVSDVNGHSYFKAPQIDENGYESSAQMRKHLRDFFYGRRRNNQGDQQNAA